MRTASGVLSFVSQSVMSILSGSGVSSDSYLDMSISLFHTHTHMQRTQHTKRSDYWNIGEDV
eukprot:m.77620 g.77620  ORF g.77620 m.77620 type:complete len:62 (+) comp11925_c0_seq1:833-1018(+)